MTAKIDSKHEEIRVRMATVDDAREILAIYAPFVDSSIISFEYKAPTLPEFETRMREYLEFAPWLVAVQKGKVLGYAYASKYRAREAYSWAIESSVYLADEAKGLGIATKLYDQLFSILIRCGYRQALAGITLPNEASVRFHQKTGFELIGVYPKIGFKYGAWHDVGWYRKELASFDGAPSPIRHYLDL